MMASDHVIGNGLSQVILRPMKISTPARPKRSERKLRHRRRQDEIRASAGPRIANTLEVKTISGSLVSAKIAGTESIANTMSLISMAISARNSGVACHTPIDANEEVLAVELVGHRHEPPRQPHERIAIGRRVARIVKEHRARRSRSG